jgi:hypothetical protein
MGHTANSAERLNSRPPGLYRHSHRGNDAGHRDGNYNDIEPILH